MQAKQQQAQRHAKEVAKKKEQQEKLLETKRMELQRYLMDVQVVSRRTGKPWLEFHLTECINQMVLQGQLPHKIVNLLITVTKQNHKLTILWGS